MGFSWGKGPPMQRLNEWTSLELCAWRDLGEGMWAEETVKCVGHLWLRGKPSAWNSVSFSSFTLEAPHANVSDLAGCTQVARANEQTSLHGLMEPNPMGYKMEKETSFIRRHIWGFCHYGKSLSHWIQRQCPRRSGQVFIQLLLDASNDVPYLTK